MGQKGGLEGRHLLIKKASNGTEVCQPVDPSPLFLWGEGGVPHARVHPGIPAGDPGWGWWLGRPAGRAAVEAAPDPSRPLQPRTPPVPSGPAPRSLRGSACPGTEGTAALARHRERPGERADTGPQTAQQTGGHSQGSAGAVTGPQLATATEAAAPGLARSSGNDAGARDAAELPGIPALAVTWGRLRPDN